MKRYIKLIILSIIILNPLTGFALSKTETVYATLDSNGHVKSTKINTQISNLNKGDVVDYTKLEDIKNINGDEKFNLNGSKLTWKSVGQDIFYQGKINNKLPITVEVKYYLNGKEISFEKLKDKKGSIKIDYTFINSIYDSDSGLYTPFVVSLISPVNGKDYNNLKIVNGKVVKTGDKNIIIGVAAPGLSESLPIDDVGSLDKITISYDTDKFKANEVYFAITPKLLDKVDLSKLGLVDTATSSINTLQDGVNKLESGSFEFADGVIRVDDGLSTLNNGINEALNGSREITNGLNQIAQGSSKLSGMNTLVDELYNTYVSNSELLNNITSGVTAEQLYLGIQNATLEKTNLENKLSEVNSGIQQLESIGEDNLNEEQKVQLATLRLQKTQIEAGIEQYAKGIADASANLQALPQAAAKLSGANEAILKVLMGILGVSSKEEVNETSINAFKAQMNALVSGIDALHNGSNKLTSGLNELAGGGNQLKDGTSKLRSGSLELSSGISKLNNEGIKKISSYAGKINNYSSKVKKLVNLAKDYKGFGSNNSDNTLFVYKITK